MAGIDKINEFYTCLERFSFLIECYCPDDIPLQTRDAFDEVQIYSSRCDIRKRIEESKQYFDSFDENREKFRMKEMMDYIIQKYVKQD